MQPLETSLPQRIGSSNSSSNSTSQPQAIYASERARLLFGQYPRGGANDPEIYVATVAAILSEYPVETIRHVTDPRTGLAANPPRDPQTGRAWGGLPYPHHVTAACEAHHGPKRRAAEREAQERKQIAEREAMERVAARNRAERKKTYQQLIEDCQARGLKIGPQSKFAAGKSVDDLCVESGVSRETFDALPDAPKPKHKAD